MLFDCVILCSLEFRVGGCGLRGFGASCSGSRLGFELKCFKYRVGSGLMACGLCLGSSVIYKFKSDQAFFLAYSGPVARGLHKLPFFVRLTCSS